jgi:hypothetical protein
LILLSAGLLDESMPLSRRLLPWVFLFCCSITTAEDGGPKKAEKNEERKDDYQVTIKGEVNDQLAPVAGKLTEVFFDSYPKLVKRFDNPDKPAPRHITVVFKSKIRVPAYCTGDTVTVSVEWLTQHPEDLGMLTHELTHAVQGYPNPDPGWITEGIADYTRKVYGPKEQPNWELPKTLTAKNSYRESYRVAARFFEWLDEKHPESVDKIHRKMQKGEFVTEDFERITGAPLDTLWEQCVEELSGKP